MRNLSSELQLKWLFGPPDLQLLRSRPQARQLDLLELFPNLAPGCLEYLHVLLLQLLRNFKMQLSLMSQKPELKQSRREQKQREFQILRMQSY